MTTERYRVERYRIVELLRLLSAGSLLVLALAFFWQPIRQVTGPSATRTLQRLPLPAFMRPSGVAGFMVRVVSEPSGARVVIDGTDRGRAPLFANVPCEDGQRIEIVVAKQGFPRWQRGVDCRVGGELVVRARLNQ
ncbi:MAG: PEGA domain-containing protein [bacterium]|nr:PEGA domain-containing protein [bacterium]